MEDSGIHIGTAKAVAKYKVVESTIKPYDIVSQEEFLNSIAHEGWDLVCAMPVDDWVTFYMRKTVYE